MKKIFALTTLARVAGVMCCLALASFSFIRGGDSFTILQNDTQVVKYSLFSKDPLPSLTVNVSTQDQYSVYYSECGKIGTSRALSIRDEKGSVLREWKFANSLSEHTPMIIKAKDLALKGQNLGMYYTSNEVHNPRKLVNLIINGNTNSASR